MNKYKKIGCIFPGQGTQYPGMGKDFVREFSAARLTFEEADDLLERKLSDMILNGPESTLKETKNSQVAIFVASLAIFRVLKELFEINPFVCAGLSLGEYTALTAGEHLLFTQCLPLVQRRGELMNEACEKTKGTMAVILGLNAEEVEGLVKELKLPHDLWIANFNCPGQVVISGTMKGIELGTAAALAKGAKRVLPLQVHGAFHSGLMQTAQDKLGEAIQRAPLKQGSSSLVMNVPGDFVKTGEDVKTYLTRQVTHSVKWEQGIRAMDREGVDLLIEIGPQKTLTGMNKKIGVKAHTIGIEKLEDIDSLSKLIKE